MKSRTLGKGGYSETDELLRDAQACAFSVQLFLLKTWLNHNDFLCLSFPHSRGFLRPDLSSALPLQFFSYCVYSSCR